MSSAGGCPSWQAMVSMRTSIVPPGPCPPLPDTPRASSAVTAPQVTASCTTLPGPWVLGQDLADLTWPVGDGLAAGPSVGFPAPASTPESHRDASGTGVSA